MLDKKIIHKIIWCDKGWQPVHYGFCPSEKAWNMQMKYLKISGQPYPSSSGRITTFTHDDGCVCCIMTLKDEIEHNLNLVEFVGIFVHEATHVWQEILLAIKEANPSPEFEAYSMQAICQELLEAFHKSNRCPSMSKYLTMRS